MKTNTKPANRFRRPFPAVICCLGLLPATGTLVSCGTNPSGMTTSRPVALRSEYQLKSWRDSANQSGDETLKIFVNPIADHDFIPVGGVINGTLLTEVMGTMTGEISNGLRLESNDAIGLYDDVASTTETTSRRLLEPDESTRFPASGTPGEGFWNEQASR